MLNNQGRHLGKDIKGDFIFTIANNIFLSLCLIIVAYPIIYVLSASFSDPDALIQVKVWLWPGNPSLDGYITTFTYPSVWKGFYNSLIYTVSGTAINVVVTIIAAYPLLRKDFLGRNAIMFLFAFTMWFSGGMIPTYLLIRNLKMIDTRWALLIPGAMSVWNMIIMRTYFQTNIPAELLEASRMDGCNDFTFLWKIIIPLSGPIIAVISLFYAVGHWNSYFNAFLYLSKRELMPLQIILREVLIMNQATEMLSLTNLKEVQQRERLAELLKYSLIVVSSLPVIVIYPLVQKHFVKGIMVGAIKG